MKPSITREPKRKFMRRTFAGFRRPSLIAPKGHKTRRIGVAGAIAILIWSAGSASADGLFVNGLGARARSMVGHLSPWRMISAQSIGIPQVWLYSIER